MYKSVATFTLIIILMQTACSSNEPFDLDSYKPDAEWYQQRLLSVLNNVEEGENGMVVQIKKIEEREEGWQIEYSMEAKENAYVIDYDAIDCTIAPHDAFFDKGELYIVLHAGLFIYCESSPLEDIYATWPLVLIKKGEKLNFNVFISKKDVESQKENFEQVSKAILLFGYMVEENLKSPFFIFKEIDGRHIKVRAVTSKLHKYKKVETDIQWE